MISRSCIAERYPGNYSPGPLPDEPTHQTGPIAVYGATGYTGRIVAGELARRGADLVLAGRDAGKVEEVARAVGGAATAAVPLDDAGGLRGLLEPCAAVISCAGPFVAHGEPVLRAAVASATHYIDTTGEQSFIRSVFEDHGPEAARAGIALVTAMGFDYAPGDLIAALTAEGMGALDEIVLAYAVRGFGASRGTMKSALGMLGDGDVEWRDGRLVGASRRIGRGSFEFDGGIGRQRMARYPAGEQITVPRHVQTRNVRTMLTAATVVPHPRLAALAGLTAPLQLALRTPARRLIAGAVERLPEGPTLEARRRARFEIVCEARAGSRRRRGVVDGSDVYGLTAVTTAEAALRCAAPGYDRSGALAPSQAFHPQDFLDSLSSAGLTYRVDPLPAG
jgi:short subunit dehydrogenase-like uncharacterized protein